MRLVEIFLTLKISVANVVLTNYKVKEQDRREVLKKNMREESSQRIEHFDMLATKRRMTGSEPQTPLALHQRSCSLHFLETL